MRIMTTNSFTNIQLSNGAYFREVEKYTRFREILEFQKFMYTHNSQEIRAEFIMLSQSIYFNDQDIDEEYEIYNYKDMRLFEDILGFGYQRIEFEPALRLQNLWIKIPCKNTECTCGVNSSIINHLLGIGDCLRCFREYGNARAAFYPNEY